MDDVICDGINYLAYSCDTGKIRIYNIGQTVMEKLKKTRNKNFTWISILKIDYFHPCRSSRLTHSN